MTRYLIRRLLWAVLLFFAVTIVAYILFFIIPADPAKQFAGKGATPETIAKAKHYLHLDEPIYQQYGHFVWRLVVPPATSATPTTTARASTTSSPTPRR